METLKIDNLFARRSIRDFAERLLRKDQIQTLLRAAMAAPSAGDFKPWHFIIVMDEARRTALAKAHGHADMLIKAPVGFIVCGEPTLSFPDQPAISDYWIQDAAAATENLLLAAVGLGLGAVWCGVFPVAERVQSFRRILEIPERVIPFSLVPVGYPAERKEPRTQYDENRVHTNSW